MPQVSVPRDRIADGSLPSVCVVCGADAPHRLFPSVSSPSLAWLLFSPLIGLLTFWSYILWSAQTHCEQSAGLPFCDKHRNYWPRRAQFIIVGFVAVVVPLVIGGVFFPPEAGNLETHWIFTVVGIELVIYLPAFMLIQLTSMRPTESNRKTLVLSGACREFAAAVERERDPS